MASFNRVILLGNLTRDPELRYSGGGMAIAKIGLAVNERRKSPNGDWVDETCFVDVTLFGRTAEIAGEYLSKGSPMLVEGRLKLDSWEGKDGEKRSKLVVIGDRMQLLSGRGEGGESRGGGGGGRAPASRSSGGSSFSQDAPHDDFEGPPAGGGGGGGGGGDDIPF